MLTGLLACYADNNVSRLQSGSEKIQAFFCFWNRRRRRRRGKMEKKILRVCRIISSICA